MNSLELIEIKNPMDHWDNTEVKSMFFNVLDLRIKGFGIRYEQKIIPVDPSDFASDHYLYLVDKVPAMTIKYITYKTCLKFNLSYPVNVIAKNSNALDVYQFQDRLNDQSLQENFDICYIGGFTIDSQFKSNVELYNKLKNLAYITSFFYFHTYLSTGSFMTTLVVPDFKVDKIFEVDGFKEVSFENKKIAQFSSQFLRGKLVKFLVAHHFTEKSSFCNDYFSLWKNRQNKIINDLDKIKRAS